LSVRLGAALAMKRKTPVSAIYLNTRNETKNKPTPLLDETTNLIN